MSKIIKNDDGSYTTSIVYEPRGEEGSTVFTFSEIDRAKRSEFYAFVEVTIHHEKQIHRFSGRLNLASLSAREGFVRSLGRITKFKKEFDSYLSEAIESLISELNKMPRSESVIEIEPMTGNTMLFSPFITDKSANLIFGDGSSTKSYICIHLAISLVTGLPFAGYTPQKTVNVLFLDYEDVAGKFSDRVHRVVSGMRNKPDLEQLGKLRYMKARGVALCDCIQAIKEEIAKHHIELLIIDSAAYACGAEIEKAENVIRYFNALDNIGIASLAIAHVTKSSTELENKTKGQQHAIGSIYFHNAPRNIWNVVKQGDENDQESIKKVCMFHRKCNDTKLNMPIPLEVDFSEINKTSIRLGKSSDWEDTRPLSSKIVDFLRKEGSKSRKSIMEEFDEEKENTIKLTLKRMKKTQIIGQIGGNTGDYFLVK